MPVIQSALVAMCLATLCLQLVSLLGTSLPAWLAQCAALALGIALGASPRDEEHGWQLPGISNTALLHFGLAAWIVASPWLVEIVDRSITVPGVISLSFPLWNAITLFAVSAFALGIPAYLAARALAEPQVLRPGHSRRPGLILLGAGMGLAAWGIGLAQILGPWLCGILASSTSFVMAAVQSYRRSDDESASVESASSRAGDQGPAIAVSSQFSIAGFLTTAVAALSGGWLAALGRLLEQLMPGSIDLPCAESVGLCLGAAMGVWIVGFGRRMRGSVKRKMAWAVGGVAGWGVSLVAAFPALVLTALGLNAYVAKPWVLLVSRGSIAAAVIVPVGIVAAVSLGEVRRGKFLAFRRAIWLSTAFLGYWLTSAWGLREYSMQNVLIGLAWLSIAAAAVIGLMARSESPAARWQWVVAGLAVAFVVVGPRWRGNVDVRRSARLLFNANAAFAYRSGLDASLLAALDEARPVATAAGERGVYTVWSFGGHQVQLRENGVPRGVASTDAAASPRFVPETLQAILPLVLHDRPRRILLSGLGSGESLAAAARFPIPEINCLDADAALVRLLRAVAGDASTNALDDDRVSLSICDPLLGLAAARSKFDVIVSSPEHLSLARSQPYLTAEFYRRVAHRLTADGVFCQRLQFVDFGPRVLQTIVATVQSVFRDTLAIEVAPGEYLLAATNDSRGLFRPGLAARFEFPHVRAVLAESGIDWTVVLNLDAADRKALAKFVAASSGTLNTASAGRLPFSMPREVMRWAAKPEEVHKALIPRGGRLLSWIGDDAASPVLVRRLAEVQGQFDLMTNYADQYWAYRASLRDQVKEKSRSKIELASATDEKKQLHAEDYRRLRYFEVLGQAARTARAADIERLAAFASPYDPLISYFVQEEAAELCARSPDRDFASELRHRLYVTFFSSPKDASLRNVIAALALLREHPEAEPESVVRWDDLNALLQALKLRWDARTGVRPTNLEQVMSDIDTTLLAVEQTFHELDRLTTEAGLPAEMWKARRTVLEKSLIRPVKAYQLELLPHLRRRQAEKAEGGGPGMENGTQPMEDAG
jgi:hypothetical protein